MGYVKHSAGGQNLITDGTFIADPTNYDWQFGAGWAWNPTDHVMEFTPGSTVEMLTNPTFTGSAAGWTLGAQWTYNSNGVLHGAGGSNFDASNTVSQATAAIEGKTYLLELVITELGSGSFIKIGLGDNTYIYELGQDPAAGTTTFRVPIQATGADGILYISSDSFRPIRIESASLKDCLLVKQVSVDDGAPVTIGLEVGGSVGSIDLFPGIQVIPSNITTGTYKYNFAAGAGAVSQENIPLLGGLLIFMPSATFNGTLTNISLNDVYVDALFESGVVDYGFNYIVRLAVGGTTGSVVVSLGSEGVQYTFAAGSGNVNFTDTPSGSQDIIITPTHDFNGTIDNVSIKLSTGGPELANNGTFNGPHPWADKAGFAPGWTYRGGSGNSGQLPTYATSLMSAIARVQQGLATPSFIVGAYDNGAGTYGLFKKSTNYVFSLLRTALRRYNNPFAVEEIRFNINGYDDTGLQPGMVLSPVLVIDGGATRVEGTEISMSNYAQGTKFIKLGPANFGYQVRGKSDWCIEFQSLGEELCSVKLPIFAEVDVDEDP